MPEKIKTTDGVTITETEPVNEKSRWTRSLNYNERSEYESGKKYFDCCDWFSMPELEPFDFANGSIGMKFACKNIRNCLGSLQRIAGQYAKFLQVVCCK